MTEGSGAGPRPALRPIAQSDFEPLRRMREEPEVARWWGRPDAAWPVVDDPDLTQLAIEVDGELAGYVQFWEERHPDHRHADVDIFLTSRLHGHGFGTETMRAVAAALEERGHHRLTLSTDPGNARAIRAYEKAGFRAVGITRLSARADDGTWRDELLMERVTTARV